MMGTSMSIDPVPTVVIGDPLPTTPTNSYNYTYKVHYLVTVHTCFPSMTRLTSSFCTILARILATASGARSE